MDDLQSRTSTAVRALPFLNRNGAHRVSQLAFNKLAGSFRRHIAFGRVSCRGVFSQLKRCRVRNTAVRQVDCVSPKVEAGHGNCALSDPGSGPLIEKPDPSKWGNWCGSQYHLRPGLTVLTSVTVTTSVS